MGRCGAVRPSLTWAVRPPAQRLRRQAIMERVGNCVFVRLRASVFNRDPDAAMGPIWERAEELGILVGAPH